MSKGISGLFSGTTGANEAILTQAQDMIASRVGGLDLREHPRRKSLQPTSSLMDPILFL